MLILWNVSDGEREKNNNKIKTKRESERWKRKSEASSFKCQV